MSDDYSFTTITAILQYKKSPIEKIWEQVLKTQRLKEIPSEIQNLISPCGDNPIIDREAVKEGTGFNIEYQLWLRALDEVTSFGEFPGPEVGLLKTLIEDPTETYEIISIGHQEMDCIDFYFRDSRIHQIVDDIEIFERLTGINSIRDYFQRAQEMNRIMKERKRSLEQLLNLTFMEFQNYAAKEYPVTSQISVLSP